MSASAESRVGKALSTSRFRHASHRVSQVLLVIFRAALIIGISYIILFPILMKVSSSFMSRRDLVDQTVKWIPKHFTWDNYRLAVEMLKFPTVFRNSLQLSVIVSILQLCSSILLAWPCKIRLQGEKSDLCRSSLYSGSASSDDHGPALSQLEVL